MRNTNIELYLKYSNNQQGYEKIYQRSFNELLLLPYQDNQEVNQEDELITSGNHR